MASTIDPTKPAAGAATTLSVRNNFLAAKNEIESLQTEVAAKQAALVSGSNIKTINGTSILGAGDIAVSPQITISATPPGTPVLNQLWLDIS